jgi:hypothetical protein
VGSLQTYELSLPSVKKLKTIALKASKKKVEASFEEDSEEEESVVAMLAKNFRRLMRDDQFKKKFYEKVKLPENLILRKRKRRIPEGLNVLNAQVLGIFKPIAGILRRERGRRTM